MGLQDRRGCRRIHRQIQCRVGVSSFRYYAPEHAAAKGLTTITTVDHRRVSSLVQGLEESVMDEDEYESEYRDCDHEDQRHEADEWMDWADEVLSDDEEG